MRSPMWPLPVWAAVSAVAAFPTDSAARPPIRRAFFDAYPSAEGTRLDDLASNAGHCGVCHFDFDGGGPRNPYGLDVEVALGALGDELAAVLSVENEDSDGDGYTNLVEITDTTNFSNTPTFPGLTSGNVGGVSHVDAAEISGHLTPSGGTDTTPPSVAVLSPNGGESYGATTTQNVAWTATDASGVAHVDLYFSDDEGVSYRPVALGQPNSGTYAWFVPNRPGPNSRIRVVARDNAGNYGSDESDADFTVVGSPSGIVPTTLRDFDLPGSQPLQAGTLEDPSVNCVTCHGDYDSSVEPWFNWRGSMMGHALRDPLFTATMVIAEQDAPAAGDLCIRCHTPGGWLEGRSVDTSGGMLTAKDRQSVQCDFCHRQVDPIYQAGVSPIEDLDILNALLALPPTYANGEYVVDPNPIRRGPYADAAASHAFLESPFHRVSNICGTCHDVSNPAFVAGANPGEYVPNAFDAPHPDGDPRNMFPVERTFSEWSVSEYATNGVYAPQFAGDKPDGIVSTCQDCHVRDTTGRGCNQSGAPNRTDLPLHDFTGGNTFIPDVLPDYYPAEVDVAALQAGKARATDMLTKAATLELAGGVVDGVPHLWVEVTNETGHKLPSGYPEGRRIWIDVRAYDAEDSLVYESGAYDPDTGVLAHDADLKVYEIHAGVSTRLASLLGVPAGPSFHFVLNDTVYLDNRIPPRGFTNANFEAVQSPPVGYAYADGAYSDNTLYLLPETAARADVTLYYQSTSKEYIEFLRDENTTNSAGDDLHAAWVAHGRSAPVAMATASLDLEVIAVETTTPPAGDMLGAGRPNPFGPQTAIDYSVSTRGPVTIEVFGADGRLVRVLVDGVLDPGAHRALWDGRDRRGMHVAPGTYFYRMSTRDGTATRKVVALR